MFYTSFYYLPKEQKLEKDLDEELENTDLYDNSKSETEKVITELIMLPNPVVNDLNIEYKLSRKADVWFSVHNNIGIPMCVTSPKALDEGQYFESIRMGHLSRGTYLVYVHAEYDGTGREFRQWLPVSIAGNNGQYVDINTFKDKSLMMYSNLSNDAFPYAESIYESSPLNRVLGKRNPGRDWNDHPTQIKYGANDGTIAYFYVTDGGVLYRDGNYLPNMLYKTILVDEDGKDITEYKNKMGQTVMKRNGENADTYYVYNYLGQLEYVLPPLACDEMTQSTYYYDNFSAMEKYAYVYKYDNRGNCISKRLPGCEPIYMTYDRAGRLILSQDGNQRSSLYKPVQYTVNKYDILGRVLYTGVIN